MMIGLIILAGAVATFAYSGFYNVSALQPHNEAVRYILHTVMHRSVEWHAAEVSERELTQKQASAGFPGYDEMCAGCHGAPGQERDAIGKGLNPKPPDLSRRATEWKPNELFWIVRNGIKMTAMPAFGASHDDDTIWNIVAFVRSMPGLSAEDYKILRKNRPTDEKPH